jgi:hypothetical protein
MGRRSTICTACFRWRKYSLTVRKRFPYLVRNAANNFEFLLITLVRERPPLKKRKGCWSPSTYRYFSFFILASARP